GNSSNECTLCGTPMVAACASGFFSESEGVKGFSRVTRWRNTRLGATWAGHQPAQSPEQGHFDGNSESGAAGSTCAFPSRSAQQFDGRFDCARPCCKRGTAWCGAGSDSTLVRSGSTGSPKSRLQCQQLQAGCCPFRPRLPRAAAQIVAQRHR